MSKGYTHNPKNSNVQKKIKNELGHNNPNEIKYRTDKYSRLKNRPEIDNSIAGWVNKIQNNPEEVYNLVLNYNRYEGLLSTIFRILIQTECGPIGKKSKITFRAIKGVNNFVASNFILELDFKNTINTEKYFRVLQKYHFCTLESCNPSTKRVNNNIYTFSIDLFSMSAGDLAEIILNKSAVQVTAASRRII